MSETYRTLQVQLLRALVIQVFVHAMLFVILHSFQFSIPILFTVIPSILIIGLPATGHRFGQADNVLGFIASAFPVFDPICMILAYPK